ncbi:GTD-binding domain-containing protein [Hirschfeldia incana]|nr:GTD-binding domain-containing protein [Hirschfeldia incana]
MLERSSSFRIPGAETLDLRIALYERKEVIERLQDELHAEREASATSASEALSMILRLQGEKAELAREAGQYKRIAEEEMSHAETWFAHLEDFIHQKELVITALEYQAEAYRSQLLRLGYSDLNSLDVKLEENDKNMVMVKMNHHESLSDRSQIPSPDLSIPVEKEVIEESLDSKKSYFNVYWDHIKKMDKKVKGLKTEDVLKMKVAKQTKMKKKSTKQTKDRSGKRDRADYQAELQRLRHRVEQLERERTKTVPETSGVIKHEEISRLKEMKEKVSPPMQSSEVKSSNTMEILQPWIDPAIVSVQEAMLNFWL